MKKILAILLALSLAVVLAACGGPSDDEIKAVRNVSFEGTEPTIKTSVTIVELKESTYTGTMSGGEFVNNSKTIFTTIMPADLTISIEKGQITLSCESVTSAYGMLEGVKTPQSPEGSLILSGSLTLQQSGDAVTAEGELTSLGKSYTLNHTDMKYESWDMTERKGDGKYSCTVCIAMTDGVPVATIAVDLKQFSCTATIPLALASGEEAAGSAEPLSAPYAKMLKSGDYQYTYSLVYEGKNAIWCSFSRQKESLCRLS